ncbi:MAG: hypothetical protein ACO1RX_20295 [Candidatus Sericytochromatia bacterium]
MDRSKLAHMVYDLLSQAAETGAAWPETLTLWDPLGLAWTLAAETHPTPTLLDWLRLHSEPLALHLLGFWGWQSTGAKATALPSWARPGWDSFALAAELTQLRTASADAQRQLLSAAYRRWEQQLQRSHHPHEHIRRLHALARAQQGLQDADPAVQALARAAWVVLSRRCSDDRHSALTQWQAWQEVLKTDHPLTKTYAAVLVHFAPARALSQDQRRATHFRQNYLQQLAQGQLASSAIEKELNRYLKANALQIASLQALVREPDSAETALRYRLLNLPTHNPQTPAADLSFQALGIFGWYGGQWHSALHYNAAETARQRSYQTTLANYWHFISLNQLHRLSPRQPFHTSWIPEGDLRLAQLCASLLAADATPEQVLAELGLDRPGTRQTQVHDALERWILLPRSQGNEGEWSTAQQPLALLAWILGADTLLHKGAGSLLPGAQRLSARHWPDTVPATLQHLRTDYLALSPQTLAQHWLPWPLFSAELNLTPPESPPFVCFVHPLGYEQLGSSLERVPAALICGRLYLRRESAGLPFVASTLREHLQPLSELCRDLVDTVMHQSRKQASERLAQHQSELARLQERQRLFGDIQTQMRAYDQARQAAEQLWQGISHALTPPAYAAYGILDYQRLLHVFNEHHSLPNGMPGAHNLSSVTPQRLEAYFDYLNAGAIVTDTFLGQLQQSWAQLPERNLALAQRYFALLKLVVHDAFDPQRPLSLLQVLVALRLALKQRPVRYSLALEDTKGTRDLSDLLCPDRCSSSRFMTSLAELSGFDFQALAYSFGTRPAHVLPLPAGIHAASLCLALTQLLHTELYQPDNANALHLEAVRTLWLAPGGCLLWLDCRGQAPADWPQALERSAGDTRPHSLRDALAQLAQATQHPALRLHSVPHPEAIETLSGLQIWNLPHQRCVLTLSLGMAAHATRSLPRWLSVWEASEHARTGI